MEDSTNENKSNKRVRDDSGSSPELKRSRVDSVADLSGLNRVDSETQEINSPETKISDDIIDILDDPDSEPEIEDLDSVIKSFEEEILNPDPATDSGELVYLLGASDDELGLPPAFSPSDDGPDHKVSDLVINPPDAVELNENFAFVDELPNYDSFGFGIGEDNGGSVDFVTLGGLFDYSDGSEYSWRPESLRAL